eukprot:1194937-Prorocentrum_minimum.AAC.9
MARGAAKIRTIILPMVCEENPLVSRAPSRPAPMHQHDAHYRGVARDHFADAHVPGTPGLLEIPLLVEVVRGHLHSAQQFGTLYK